MTITVLSKSNCVACIATTTELDKHGLPFSKINIEEDAEAYERAISLGHMSAPVVIIEETGESWSGYRPEKIAELAVS